MKRLPVAAEALLSPFASAYGAVMRARNIMFEHGLRKASSVAKPVISIGNLTAGGTGKTPITAYLVEQLEKRNFKIGIVSRGYGGTSPGPTPVAKDGSADSAARFGDEPSWLAHRFPKASVFVGSDRVEACRALLNGDKVDVIIADDAFQHRRLKRDIDIVLLDATEPRWHYRSLPLGRMRENFAALERAKFVFITKTNLADAESVRWLREKCERFAPKASITEFSSRILKLASLESHDSRVIEPANFKEKRVMLVSAIGRPEAFQKLFDREAGITSIHHLVFPDHHAYTQADFARIDDAARAYSADAIVVTEKDAVKLAGQWQFATECWVTHLEMRPEEELIKLYEIVDRLLL